MFKEDKQMIRTNLMKAIPIAVAALLIAGPAQAVVPPAGTITFDDVFGAMGSQTGVIGYDMDTGTLHGIDIVFTIATGSGTPMNSGTDFLCDTCLLNFAVSVTPLGGSEFEVDPDGGTNTFVLTGEVPLADTASISSTLLSGEFTEGENSSGGAFFMGSQGLDEKNDNLVEFFYGQSWNLFTFVFTAQAVPENKMTDGGGAGFALPGGSIHGMGDLEVWWEVLTEVDLSNAPTIPEPATTSIFLLGLGALAAYRRRKN